MKSVFLKLILVLIVGLSLSNATTIKVGSSGGYYPFTYYENDVLKGFEIDIWRAIGKKLGAEIEFKTAKFSGLFGMLESGKLDTISNQITITDKRKAKYWFSEPYVYDGAHIIVHKDTNDIKSINDLVGKKVGVPLGSNYEELLRKVQKEELKGAFIDIITYDTGGSQELDVELKRTVGYIQDKVSALALIKEKKRPLKVAGEPIELITNAFPFVRNDKNKELIKRVNGAIRDLKADGTFKRISNNWFNDDITSR